MPVRAIIEMAFDPVLRAGQVALPWQTIGVTVALLAALGLAASMLGYPSARSAIFRATSPKGLHRPVRRRLVGANYPEAPPLPTVEPPARQFAADELLFIVLGTVPGAVAGGRLLHGLSFIDAYAARPATLLDVQLGSLSLFGAVIGGTVSGAVVARLIGAPIRRWADVAALPLLVGIGVGKLAQFLGGSGQGAAFDGPWAVSFTGAGPWVSAAAALPAHPAQVYEGMWVLAGLPVLLWLAGRAPDSSAILRVDGRLYVAALGWFAIGRVVVGFSWRDDAVVGPLNAEQLYAGLLLLALGLVMTARALRDLPRRRRLTPPDGRRQA